MEKEALVANLMLAINYLVSLLKKGWQNVGSLVMSSAWETGVGNFPALDRPGPRRRGICLIRPSEAQYSW
jgi:hypothetical protein